MLIKLSAAAASLASTSGRAWRAPGLLASREYATQEGKSLLFAEHGAPERVLQLERQRLPAQMGAHDVLINILATPINPSDINTIEGKYLIATSLPAVPGHEGVGVVEAVGPEVKRMQPGDRVVPIEHGQGTWRTHGVFNELHWYKIPKDLPIAAAATMAINPPTAVRLLEEFVHLGEGDTLVQSGATSHVGQLVIQLAKSRGIRTVNLIRDREDRPQVERELRELGATLVTTAGECRQSLKKAGLPQPKLALDCVAGDMGATCAKALAPGGTMVVYGAMSQQPVTLPPGLLIFNDIRLRGFWLTGGYAKMKDGWRAKEQLVDRVCALFRTKVFKPPSVDCVPLDQWPNALKKATTGFRSGKVLLTSFSPDELRGAG